jgi:hypothetical protein
VDKRTRSIGAVVVVGLVAALVVRYVTQDDKSRVVQGADAAPSRFIVSRDTHAIHALSSGADAVLAVGDDGAILRHRATGDWTEEPSGVHVPLRAVAEQLDEAIAVGDGGVIVERGAAWAAITSPTTRTLRAVAYTSYGAIAVGDGGTIVRRPAPHEAWRLEASHTTADLDGACAGLRDAWTVGQGGAILFYAPSGWVTYAPPTNETLFAVACDDHAAIAVGAHGVVVERLDDVPWHDVSSGTTADLHSVSSPFGSRSWLIAGTHGTVVRISGAATVEPSGVDWDLDAVTEGPIGTWLVGSRGILARTR